MPYIADESHGCKPSNGYVSARRLLPQFELEYEFQLLKKLLTSSNAGCKLIVAALSPVTCSGSVIAVPGFSSEILF
ncbi:MAG: hypothetical protein ONB11_12485 [candidate division KSB1 bacterium]|nr:hypothetical protein [candidate division KSB1 bacterium]